MDDENQTTTGSEDALEPQDTTEEIELDLSEEEDEQIDWEAKAKKADELANNYKIRAEKAEKLAKQNRSSETSQRNDSNLSTLDIIAITKSSIDMDDLPSVQKYAKMEGISVSEALKSDELKAILAVKAEKKTVAQASHSGASRRSNFKLSDDALLANAKKGILPDSDSDMERFHELTMKGTR
jgi:hypothetical protein